MTPSTLALLFLAATATAHASSDAPPPRASPRDAVAIFESLCLRAPSAWAAVERMEEDRDATVTGGTLPTPETPSDARFTIDLDGAPAQVAFSGSECSVQFGDIDAKATVARLDALIAERFAGWERFEPAQALASPGGVVLRVAHATWTGATHGTSVAAVASAPPDAPQLTLTRWHVSMATGAQDTVEYAPSEDLAGREGKPPRYPGAALRTCAGGTTLSRVTVDARGDVVDVVVHQSAGRQDLDEAAVDAVRQWRYFPGVHAGRLVGGDILVPVRFTPRCGR